MSAEVEQPEVQGLKLNLGSGRRVIPGWINIDIHPLIPLSKIPGATWLLFKLGMIKESAYKMKWPSNTLWHDIRKGLPFDDNTADFIYASHFFEHVKEDEAEKISLECYRVLKPGGL
ncbi:MAG: methyltransferase domain-containing protein, partial [Methanobacteriota archaeon]